MHPLIHRVKARCQRLYLVNDLPELHADGAHLLSPLLHFVRKLLHPRHPG